MSVKPSDYLLNYLTVVPGTLEVVYETVARFGPVTLDQCRKLLQFRGKNDAKEDHVLEALNFLTATDVLQDDGAVYRAPAGVLEPFAFRALLLKGLKAQTGKQSDFMRIHDYLVRAEVIGITVGLLMAFLNEKKFKTADGAAINDFKLGFWMRLLDFIGVVHQLRGTKSITLTPDVRMMHYLLREASGGASEVGAARYLESVERQYFPVITQNNGQLHPGVGAAILQLQDRGLIGLATKSDATAIRFSPAVAATHLIVKEGRIDG